MNSSDYTKHSVEIIYKDYAQEEQQFEKMDTDDKSQRIRKLFYIIFHDTSKTNRMRAIQILKNHCSIRRYVHILAIAENTEYSLANKIQIRRIIKHTRRHKK